MDREKNRDSMCPFRHRVKVVPEKTWKYYTIYLMFIQQRGKYTGAGNNPSLSLFRWRSFISIDQLLSRAHIKICSSVQLVSADVRENLHIQIICILIAKLSMRSQSKRKRYSYVALFIQRENQIFYFVDEMSKSPATVNPLIESLTGHLRVLCWRTTLNERQRQCPSIYSVIVNSSKRPDPLSGERAPEAHRCCRSPKESFTTIYKEGKLIKYITRQNIFLLSTFLLFLVLGQIYVHTQASNSFPHPVICATYSTVDLLQSKEEEKEFLTYPSFLPLINSSNR